MAYDEYLADRIRASFRSKSILFDEKRMMGGLCFLVNDKMCCGIHFDKKKNTHLLMARIGETAAAKALNRKGCLPMDFTGRPMKDYVFIAAEAWDTEQELSDWIQLCMAFNPLAKSSKRKSN